MRIVLEIAGAMVLLIIFGVGCYYILGWSQKVKTEAEKNEED